VVLYDFLDLDQITLSYAATVHKSQGSEAEFVIFLALTQHFIMLARNLAYTAVSRAKKQAVIIGSHKAMAIAVRNDKPKERYSRFKERLIGR
jgi:exodeoxyribonuclease V alpha subunit